MTHDSAGMSFYMQVYDRLRQAFNGRRVIRVVLVFMTVYPWIKYFLKRWEAVRLAPFFPSSPELDFPLLGIMKSYKDNMHRFFHMSEGFFRAVQKENNLKRCPKSIQVIPPFFSIAPAQILTMDPELIRHVTRTKFDIWTKTTQIVEIFAEGLGEQAILIVNHGKFFNGDYEKWKLQRRTAMAHLSTNFYNTSVKVSLDRNLSKIFRNIDAKLPTGEGIFDLKEQFFALTLDVIGEVALDMQLNTLDADSIYDLAFPKALDDVFFTAKENVMTIGFGLFGKYYPKKAEYHSCRKIIRDFIGDVVRERRMQGNLVKRNDVLSKFILTLGDSVKDDILIDFSYSIFLAGRDTTANVLTWAFYLLAQHQDVQQRLYEEICEIYGADKNKEQISVESLKKLPYLDGVVFETLRLFSPLPTTLERFAQCDDILPNGCKVKKGTCVSIEVFAMNRDPERYPDPTMFKPERWISSERQTQTFDPFEFPVFFAGPRICLGKDMSFFETKHVLIELLMRYKFQPSAELAKGFDRNDVSLRDGKVLYELSFTQNLHGPLNLIVTKRK